MALGIVYSNVNAFVYSSLLYPGHLGTTNWLVLLPMHGPTARLSIQLQLLLSLYVHHLPHLCLLIDGICVYVLLIDTSLVLAHGKVVKLKINYNCYPFSSLKVDNSCKKSNINFYNCNSLMRSVRNFTVKDIWNVIYIINYVIKIRQ